MLSHISIPSIEFDILSKDKILASVCVKRPSLYPDIIVYDSQHYIYPFGSNPTTEDVMRFLEYRVLPKTRQNLDYYLKAFGLTKFNVLDILHVTHGVMFDDFLWIRFKGEELTYEDIRVR